MSEKYTVVHKKSRLLVNGEPKLPSASTIEYGEIAVNYADGHETLSIKNSGDEIATFSSDSVIEERFSAIESALTEDELVISASLNDLNDRIDSIHTPSNVSELANDSGFITGYTETDPTVPAWAKAASKPTYTASEVGAMATSERSNYLTTATTIPDETSIAASGFTKNALTAYTETDPTVPAWAKAESKPSYTASEVGAMATSERSNYATTAHTHDEYATTAHTHTASEVGAMATSERTNYLPTGTTLDSVADGTTRKLSDYSTTAHTHTASEVGAMATSERNNYLTTATTVPTEATISGSGFTKNAITGINVNGSAATVTNGVAEITVSGGGGGSTLPSVSSSDNGKVLMVVDGAWSAVTPTTIYTGNDTPLSSTGNNGDIYLQV